MMRLNNSHTGDRLAPLGGSLADGRTVGAATPVWFRCSAPGEQKPLCSACLAAATQTSRSNQSQQKVNPLEWRSRRTFTSVVVLSQQSRSGGGANLGSSVLTGSGPEHLNSACL